MKQFLLILALSCWSLISFGGDHYFNSYFNGTAIQNNTTLGVQDDHWGIMQNDPNWQQDFKNQSVQNIISLKYTAQEETYYDFAWSVDVTFRVDAYDQSNNLITVNSGLPITLSIDYDPADGVHYTDQNNFTFEGAHKVELVAISAAPSASLGGVVPNDVYLENAIQVERYYELDLADQPSIKHFEVFNSEVDAQGNQVSVERELEFKWTTIDGAEEYDLEWYFLSEYSTAGYITPGDIPDNKFTRVTVAKNSYKINLVFEEGTLFYRVRPVGVYWTNIEQRKEGKWSDSSTDKYFIVSQTPSGLTADQWSFYHENDKNWTYSAIYAEAGKRKEVISYADGSSRSRQSVTKLNTEDQAVIGEAYYDFEGRPAIQALPSPSVDRDRGIHFYHNFNLNGSGTAPFKKSDFDLDDTQDPCLYPNAAMNNSSGVSNYYSDQNPDQEGMNAYIPDAKNYPYSRTIYGRDGRVRMSAGPGELHRAGMGYETRMIYGRPNQEDLDKLFGNEAGYAKHYTMVAAEDANGQVSVSFKNLSGQTVATFMAGAASVGMDALDENVIVSNIEKDLTEFNTYYETEKAYIATTNQPIYTEGLYNFKYNVTPQTFAGLCSSPTYDCEYELTIEISDDCGMSLYTYSDVISASSTGYPLNFSVQFDLVGTYYIKKTLKLSQSALNDAVANFKAHLNSASNTCFEDLATMIANEAQNIDWSNCQDCETFCANNPTLCDVANCGTMYVDFTDECGAILDQLLSDVSPEGQYFDNTPHENEVNYDIDEWLDATFNGIEASIWGPWAASSGATINSWQDVRDNWVETWAEDIVSYHPEYCHHQWCVEKVGSKNYDYQLYNVQTFAEAVTNGWITGTNPNNMTSVLGIYSSDLILNSTFLTDNNGLNIDAVLVPYATLGSGSDLWNFAVTNLNAAMASPTNDDYWRAYRDLYVGKKNEILAVGEGADCPFLCDDNDPTSDPLNAGPIMDNIADGPITGSNCNGSYPGFAIRYNNPMYILDQQGMVNSTSGNTNAQNWGNAIAADFDFCSSTVFIFDFETNDVCGANNTGTNVPGAQPLMYVGTTQISGQIVLPGTSTTVTCPSASPSDWASSAAAAINAYGATGVSATSVGGALNITVDQTYFGENVWLKKSTDFVYDLGEIQDPCDAQPSCLCTEFDLMYNEIVYDLGDISGYTNIQLETMVVEEYNAMYGISLTQAEFSIWYADCKGDQKLSIANQNTIAANYPDLLTNCNPTFDPCNTDEVNALNAFYVTQEFESLVEEKVEEFIEQYEQHCMAPPKGTSLAEEFTINGDDNQYDFTLFYYDQAGNLTRTVPPSGVVLLSSTDVDAVKAHREDPVGNPTAVYPSHGGANAAMITEYRYNTLNEMVWQKTPDGGVAEMWYDNVGRVVASQDAEQAVATTPEYSYVKYDEQGRVLEGGVMASSTVPTVNDLNDANFPNNWNDWNHTKEVTKTDYDAVTSTTSPLSASEMKFQRSRVAASYYWDRSDDADYLTASFYGYDVHGNVEVLIQENKMLEELNQHLKRLDYDYDLISGNVNEVTYQKDQPDQFIHQYHYDADNRLVSTLTSHDGFIWDQEAKQFYYQHGPLARKEIGQQKVQGLDYAYNILGWLKGVNANQLDVSLDMGKDGIAMSYAPNGQYFHSNVARDAFGFTIGYFGHVNPATGQTLSDYDAIGASGNTFHENMMNAGGSLAANYGGELFNGNIRNLATALMDVDQNKIDINASVYRYDQKNRLKNVEVNLGADFGSMVNNQDYHVEYTYFQDGDLKTMKRNGFADVTNGTTNEMDNFTYHYLSGTHQLDHITRISPRSANATADGSFGDIVDNQSSGNYDYNKRGELVQDLAEEIKTIEWFQNGKIKSIERTTGSSKGDMEFFYGPTGQRIGKLIKNSTNGENLWEYIFYVRDAAGNVMATYKKYYSDKQGGTPGVNLVERLELKEQNIFEGKRAGLRVVEVDVAKRDVDVQYNPDGTFSSLTYGALVSGTKEEFGFNKRVVGQKMYELTNHLGNVLGVVSDKKLMYEGIDVDESRFNQTIVQYHDFADGTQGFVSNNSANSTVSMSNEQLLIQTSTNWGGCKRTLDVVAGKKYEIVFDMDLGSPKKYWIGHYSQGSLISYDYVTGFTSGEVRYEFTGLSSNMEVHIVNRESNGTAVNMYIDNFRVLEGDECDWYGGGYYDFEIENQRMNVRSNNFNGNGVNKVVDMIAGHDYEITFDASFCEGSVQPWTITAKDEVNGTWYPGMAVASGSNTYTLTAASNSTRLKFYLNNSSYNGSQTPVHVCLDNIVVKDLDESYYLADVQSYSDYYPFGMVMDGRSGSEESYRYGFQGMEKDDEVKGNGNSYTTHFRQYDPRLGRWQSIDPFAEEYPGWTPYKAFYNNPVYWIDPTGGREDEWQIIKNKDGSVKDVVWKSDLGGDEIQFFVVTDEEGRAIHNGMDRGTTTIVREWSNENLHVYSNPDHRNGYRYTTQIANFPAWRDIPEDYNKNSGYTYNAADLLERWTYRNRGDITARNLRRAEQNGDSYPLTQINGERWRLMKYGTSEPWALLMDPNEGFMMDAFGLALSSYSVGSTRLVKPNRISMTPRGNDIPYEVGDGVRRSVSAHMKGQTYIKVENSQGVVFRVKVSQLRSNMKVSIQKDARFDRIHNAKKGTKFPPVYVNQGAKGIPISQVKLTQ